MVSVTRSGRLPVGSLRSFILALVLVAAAAPAGAQSWSSTDVQWLHGSGFELGPGTRDILTFEHVSTWDFGSNFFFFDVSEFTGDDTALYGEWYSRLSWARLGVKEESTGVLRDVSFAASLNAGDGFRAYLAGATLHFSVPGVSFLDLDVMYYDDRSDADATYIVTPAWELPFRIGSLPCRFRGFIDSIGPEGERKAQLLAQPQLLVDLGRFLGDEERLFAGVEYQYWHNKYGIDGVDESLPQLMLLWQF